MSRRILTGRVVLFLLFGMVFYQQINDVLIEKGTYGTYLNYKNMNNVDVLILGSSHSQNGIGAEAIERNILDNLGKNVDVYNYSIFGMRIEQMYYVLKELLKSQKPEVIVIETFSFVETEPENREILARRAFDYFPLSVNKFEAVKYCTDGEYQTYLLPMMKYHTRWKELKADDIGYRYREELWEKKGRKISTRNESMDVADNYFQQDFSSITEQQQLADCTEEKLQDILALAKENEIKVLFLSIPFKEQLGVNSIESIKMNNYVADNYVDGDSVQMLDLNKAVNGIEFDYKYLFDEGHCNENGAEMITGILSEYLSENYVETWGEKQ